MEIGIKVVAENLRTHEKRHTTSCYFTMVALDENGNTIEVQRLTLETEAEKRQYAGAEIRKKLRQESLEKVRALNTEITEEELR